MTETARRIIQSLTAALAAGRTGARLSSLVATLALGCAAAPSMTTVRIERPARLETFDVEPLAPAFSDFAASSYLLLNQRWVEGGYASLDELNLEDESAVFWHVYSQLPETVTVYPSENYYYFILYVGGRQIWGNIRIAAGLRERGLVSFGYFEFNEFPQLGARKTGLSRARILGAADGVALTAEAPFRWRLDYRGKSVRFLLHELPQKPPAQFQLAAGERFIERTFDESGYQFFLLFNEQRNYFFWVLNEEPGVPDVLEPDKERPELVVGRRSGFAFWVDSEHSRRKVLVAIRKLNSSRNDYYDGPFDQLADNYAKEVEIAEYMQRAAPTLRGRVDTYGYFTDRDPPMRVALSCYYTYLARSDLHKFLDQARKSEDFYQFVSRRGAPAKSGLPTSGATPDAADSEAASEGGGEAQSQNPKPAVGRAGTEFRN